jgi:hypothetical protein
MDYTNSVVCVGDGRGFVVEAQRGRLIITAAHCLPHLPPPHGASYLEERTYAQLVGALGEEPTVWAVCVFVDPVADLAVLAGLDDQDLWEEAESYAALVDAATPLRLGHLDFVAPKLVLSDGTTVYGLPKAEADARMLSLDGEWFACRVSSWGDSILISDASRPIESGMSGSPVLSADGKAIGVVCVGDGIGWGSPANPYLAGCLPGWLLREHPPAPIMRD